MSTMAEPTAGPHIEITSPRLFTPGAVLATIACGLILVIPVILSVVVVSFFRFGVWTFLIPLLTVAAGVFFLPFGLENAYVARLVRPLKPAEDKGTAAFIVQLTMTPRIRSGLRAIAEDADDIGWLRFTESALLFDGDSIKLFVPFASIQTVCQRTIGLRGLFALGRRVALRVSGLPDVEWLEFADRSSWTLLSSRSRARELYGRFSRRTPGINLSSPKPLR